MLDMEPVIIHVGAWPIQRNTYTTGPLLQTSVSLSPNMDKYLVPI